MHPPTDSSPRRWSARRGLLIGIVIGIGVALVAVLLASQVSEEPTRHTPSDHHGVYIDGEHLAVELTVPRELAIDEVYANPDNGPDPECRVVRYEFGAKLTLEAVSADCAIDTGQQIINGYHGLYRTLDDVPDPVDAEEVPTRLGPATVFDQSYEEYTNERNAWEEPVAIVVLDDPVDAEFPTLVLRSDKAALSREELTEIVRLLDPI